MDTEAIEVTYDLPIWTLMSWALLTIAFVTLFILWRRSRHFEEAMPLTLAEVNDLLPFVDLHRAASEALLTATLRGGPTALDRLEEAEGFGQRALRAATNPAMEALEQGLLEAVAGVREVVSRNP